MSDQVQQEGAGAGSSSPARVLRTEWSTAKPRRSNYVAVVGERQGLKIVGEGSIFERGPHVPVTHLSYFKAPVDAFATSLQRKDRRSAREWDYVNAARCWTDVALASLALAKEKEGDVATMAAKLKLVEDAVTAAREVLSMRAQYFKDIVEHGIEAARQMSFLVEQNQDSVYSESHRAVRETLTAKVEVEAAKQMAKTRLVRANNRKKKGGGATFHSDGASSE